MLNCGIPVLLAMVKFIMPVCGQSILPEAYIRSLPRRSKRYTAVMKRNCCLRDGLSTAV